jgi:hypothetical protein
MTRKVTDKEKRIKKHIFVFRRRRKNIPVFLCERSACPVKCLPNEMRSLFHRGIAYLTGVVKKYKSDTIPF